MDPKTPRHLRGLPPEVVERLTAEDRQDFADLHTEGERRIRAIRAEWAAGEFPDFLAALDDEAAAFMYLDLGEKAPGGRFDLALAAKLGARRKLDRAAAEAAVTALRRAELVADDGEGGYRLLPPNDVPF